MNKLRVSTGFLPDYMDEIWINDTLECDFLRKRDNLHIYIYKSKWVYMLPPLRRN